MKKLMLLSLLSCAVFAKDTYLDLREKVTYAPNNETIFIYQEVSELVGDGGLKHEIAYGYVLNNDAKVGFSGSYMPKEKEWEAGLEFEYKWNEGLKSFPKLKPFLRSYMGFGGQNKSGEFQISTSLTKNNYVYSNDSQLKQLANTPATAVWEEEPKFFTFLLGGGFSYDFTKNLSLNAGVEFQPKYWNVAYRIKGDEDGTLNSMNFRQYYYNARIGLSLKF